MWRRDLEGSDNEQVTISTVVITASDHVRKDDIYTLSIKHVRSFHGKGFMASVGFGNSPKENSKVFLGTSNLAYLAALNKGESMLGEALKELAGATQ